ncbi:hypothetical protein [Nocardia thailandica]|uniref:hypothetical protein n=1 Tax=Nocardia thailandica TaxID=257275 RepID=UPI00030EAFBA|nr:hypothetical protein [Nocardia thailandica]
MEPGTRDESDHVESVFAELKLLKRGHGLHAPDVAERVGPLLRTRCGVTESDSAGDTRRKLVRTLREQCAALPGPLRDAAVAALALEADDAPHVFLTHRVSALATRMDRDPRTALRRIERSLRLLAQSLASSRSVSESDWYTERLTAFLDLVSDPPCLVEERRIVADTPFLDEIVIPYSAPTSDHRETLLARVVHGGEVVGRDQVSRSHIQFRVRLARPLAAGDSHDLTTVVELYRRELLGTYCVITPWRPCHSFDVRIRFGVATRPRAIWRIGGSPPVALHDNEPSGVPIEPDPDGIARTGFTALRPSLSYGIGWAL